MGILARFCCGLRVRLLLLVLLVCLPLVALTLHRSSEEKRRQASSWEQRVERTAQVAAREEKELVGATKQLLLAVAESSAVSSGDPQATKRLLEVLLSTYPRYSNFGVIDRNGNLVASAAPLQISHFSQQPLFKRIVSTRAFSHGRILRTAGKPTLDFGYPISGQDKDFSGLIFASLDLRWIGRFGSEIASQLPKGAVWTEIDSAGRIISRHPAPEAHIGKTLMNQALVKTATRIEKGSTAFVDANGTEMFTAFTKRPSELSDQPVTGILTISRATLFQSANKALVRNLLWLSTATALAVLLGFAGSHFLIVKPIKTLVTTSSRLAAGDLTVRTGLRHGNDELGQLTQAFDSMIESLEHREQERIKASKKLHVLSHKLVEVQESERRSIARELHDEIGQALTAAEMNLQAALQAPRAPSLERRLTASMQAVEQVLAQVHDLSLNLRPSMLDDLGLEPAVRWLTRRQAELAGLHAEFHADHLEERLHTMIETECFRVAQESLTNVVRHSGAKHVSVSLARTRSHLHLRVRDDGKGFDVAEQRNSAVRGGSLGLLSMEERASLASGGLEIKSVIGHGTEVHAWFPIRWRNSELPDANGENESNLEKA